jgi:hypothetical protein
MHGVEHMKLELYLVKMVVTMFIAFDPLPSRPSYVQTSLSALYSEKHLSLN